jgi:hypothetical protein
MNDRETISYVNKILQRLDRTERRYDTLEQYITIKNNGIYLNSPVYFSNTLSPEPNSLFSDIGSEKGFLKNLYIEGKIIYPDQLQLGINNDFIIDKLGKIGLHKTNQLDSLSIQNLPSFNIEHVKIDDSLSLIFSMDGDLISNYITTGDVLKFDDFYYSVLEIFPNENYIKIFSMSSDAMKYLQIKKGSYINVEIFPSILGVYNHNGTNYLKINAFGDIFYKSISRNAEINIGGSVHFEKEVSFSDNINFNNIQIKTINNIEFPEDSKILTEKGDNIIFNKRFGDDLNMNNNRINEVQDPLDEKDAVNKRYVDKYLTGLKINRSVKCSSIKNIECEYNSDEETIIIKNAEDFAQYFDGIEIELQDNVLINCQENRNENGVYIFLGEDKFIRRNDFSKKQGIDNLRSYYIYVEYGEKNGKKSFVFNDIENFNWDGADIIFNTFSQSNDIHVGSGLKKVNGEVCVNIDENILGITEDKITLNKLDISKIENAYFNVEVGNGMEMNKSDIHLLDKLELKLKVDPDTFYFDEEKTLKLHKENVNINDLMASEKYINIESDIDLNGNIGVKDKIEIVDEIFPPKKISILINESESNYTKDTEISYMIASVNDEGYLTNLRKSQLYNVSKRCRSVYSQVNWLEVSDAKKYRIYRKIDNIYQYTDIEKGETEIVDILVPHNFSKIPWKDCDEPNNVNRTRKVISRITSKDSSFLQDTRFGLNTSKPKATFHLNNENGIPMLIESSYSKKNLPFIVLNNSVNKYNKNRSPYILGNDGIGVSEIEIGGHIKLITKEENGIVFITNKDDEDSNKNEEIETDAYRLQAMDGGIYSEGEITTQYPNAFGTCQNPMGNNALLFKTGCTSDAIANEAIMQWNREKLEVVPVQNGKIMNKNKVEVKNFCIDHPLDKDKYLIHACIEGPTADVYYRGRVEFERGDAECRVDLPEWFNKLVILDSVTIHITTINSFTNTCVDIDNLNENYFTIKRQKDFEQKLSCFWEVKGEREDAGFPVEPKKSDIQIERVGPYSWCV